MKKIPTVTVVLTLLILLSGMALAAEPLPKKSATPPSQKQSPGAPQQPGSKTLTTPGVSATAAFVDLAVTDIRVQEFGQGALIQVTVKNLGTASADANLYKLRVMLDGNPLQGGDQPLFNARSPIEPNQTRVTGIVPEKSGRTEVTARLIPSGAAASDNPANNILTRTLDLPVVRDLAVTEIKVQEFGQGALIQVMVKNLGTASVDANLYQLRVLLNGNPLHRGDQPPFNARNPIEPNQTRVTGFIPTQSGRIEVTASLILSGAAVNDNPANNTLTRTLDIPEVRPDFTVADLSLMPDNRIQVTIRNSGGYKRGDAQGTVEVYAGNNLIETINVREWPNPRETKVINTTDPIVGTRNVRATVNPNRTVLEMNYENNTLSKELTAHLLKPDLYVRNIGVWGIYGRRLAFIIGNSGKAASPRTIKAEVFEVFHGDRRLIGTFTLEGPIASGDNKTFRTDTEVVGRRTFRVTVDPQNEINEEREDNNFLEKIAEDVLN